jgi:hypothetical protein
MHAAARSLPLESQYGRALFETPADAYVLSIQSDIATQLWRHRRDGFLFLAYEWGAVERARPALAARRVRAHRRDRRRRVDAQPRDDRRAVARRERRADPGLQRVVGRAGRLGPQPRGPGRDAFDAHPRFNVALADLSARNGVSIVDVDAIVARAGADRLKLDAFHLNAEGCRLVAQEVVRILEDLGAFATREAARC